MPAVVYLCRDMIFTSKIREAARPAGAEVKPAPTAAALAALAADARLVIVDLRLPEALDAVRAAVASAGDARRACVGFVDHEKVEVMDAARAAGCTEVMTKGQFARAIPELVARAAAA